MKKNFLEVLKKHAKEKPEGFTVNLEGDLINKIGWYVAYKETQGTHDFENIQKVIDHAKTHDGYIGGWLDRKTGLYYFDSVRIIKDVEEAEKFAKENEQIGIYHPIKGYKDIKY